MSQKWNKNKFKTKTLDFYEKKNKIRGGGVNFFKICKGCIFKNQNLQKIYVEKYQLILYHVRLSTTLF